MVWSHQDVAFEEGLTAARAWVAVHGHLLPPATAVWDGYPVGAWVKNQRFAARAADANAQRRAGLAVGSSAGALTEARRVALEEIDPGWCPVWDAGWQRCFRLVQNLLQDGGALPVTARQSDRAGQGPRKVGDGAAARMGTAPARTAMAPGERPRDRGRR
ncbi:helicase associated domain-containing protein [Streptomyces sp. NPDC000609]|uniref:helicase associated domain-containing protein n=1 Tax=Streptomyces sp. NPDC000609 TaxID=3160957 RepID=UPI003397AD6B